jgi:hypothetical protein
LRTAESSASLETAESGQEAQPIHFFAAFVDPFGNSIDFPGIGNVLKMTRDGVSRIRKSDDFLDQLRASSLDFSQSFTWYFEFDIYPLFLIWMPTAGGSNIASFHFNSFSQDDNGVPIEKPPCTLLFCDEERLLDQEATNVISGLWEIDDVSKVLARYHQRPLAFIICVGPGDPLSAAALTFAGARYLFGLNSSDTFSKTQNDA